MRLPVSPLLQKTFQRAWPPRSALPGFFLEPTFSPDLGSGLGLLAGGILSILILKALFSLRAQKKKNSEILPLERSEVVSAVLQSAAWRRSRMDVIHAAPDAPPAPLHGACSEPMDGKHVCIEVMNDVPNEAWNGAPVNVYFSFVDHGARNFYHFSSNIIEIQREKESVILKLTFPAALTNGQRRAFVRVMPESGMVEALTLWPFDYTPQSLPLSAAALGRPPFVFRPPAARHISLVDISASGAQVRLAASRLGGQQKRWAVGDGCVMLLMLESLKEGGTLPLWLACECRRTHVSPHSADLCLGLRFTHWCVPSSLGAPIAWSEVEEEGEVPALLRWTGRANVLLSRRVA